MRRILVVVDGSKAAERAFAWALEMAGDREPAIVDLVAVADPEPALAVPPREPFFAWNPLGGDVSTPPAWADEDARRHDAHRQVARAEAEAVAASRERAGNVDVHVDVVDHAAHRSQLVHRATRADTLVLAAGSHGRLDAEALAHQVIRRTFVPVVLVP